MKKGSIREYDKESRKLILENKGESALVRLFGQKKPLRGKISVTAGCVYVGDNILPESKLINFMHFERR